MNKCHIKVDAIEKINPDELNELMTELKFDLIQKICIRTIMGGKFDTYCIHTRDGFYSYIVDNDEVEYDKYQHIYMYTINSCDSRNVFKPTEFDKWFDEHAPHDSTAIADKKHDIIQLINTFIEHPCEVFPLHHKWKMYVHICSVAEAPGLVVIKPYPLIIENNEESNGYKFIVS
jgi:hypothetical protein